MTITTHHVKDKLPKSGQWVCARYAGGNWGGSEGEEDLRYWVVVRFKVGISKAERQALPEGDRKGTYYGADEAWNNERPYQWTTFGSLDLFGQDVDYWFELPILEWNRGDTV